MYKDAFRYRAYASMCAGHHATDFYSKWFQHDGTGQRVEYLLIQLSPPARAVAAPIEIILPLVLAASGMERLPLALPLRNATCRVKIS
jgi:hypothetical protein